MLGTHAVTCALLLVRALCGSSCWDEPSGSCESNLAVQLLQSRIDFVGSENITVPAATEGAVSAPSDWGLSPERSRHEAVAVRPALSTRNAAGSNASAIAEPEHLPIQVLPERVLELTLKQTSKRVPKPVTKTLTPQHLASLFLIFLMLFALPIGVPLALAHAGRSVRASARPGSLGTLLRLKASVLVAALCHACMTFSTCIMAGAFLYIDKDPTVLTANGSAEGSVTSSLLLGACAGALSCTVVDAFGRRRALMAVMLFYISGSIITALAPNLWALLAGRLVAGFGAGICTAFMNVYIAEISPANCRGQLTSWSPFVGSLGILFSHVASAVLGPMDPLGLWRWQLLLLILPSASVLLLQGLLVESPRWLLLRGRRLQAKASIRALFPQASEVTVEAETVALEEDIGGCSAAAQLSMWALLCKKPFPVAVGCGINALQQACGINVVMFFGPVVLKHVGFSDHEAMVATIVVVGCQSLSGLVAAALMDRVGRRGMTMTGMPIMMLGLLILSAAFAGKLWFPSQQLLLGLVSVAGIIIFRTSYGFSLGPLPHIMTGELFSAEGRAAGTALSLTAYWATNFIVCQSYPMLRESLAAGMGWDLADAAIFVGFFGINAVAFVVVRRALPETNGLQLDKALDGKPAREDATKTTPTQENTMHGKALLEKAGTSRPRAPGALGPAPPN